MAGGSAEVSSFGLRLGLLTVAAFFLVMDLLFLLAAASLALLASMALLFLVPPTVTFFIASRNEL